MVNRTRVEGRRMSGERVNSDIKLRALEHGDLTLVHKWLNDPVVNKGGTMTVLPWSLAKISRMFDNREFESDDRRYLVVQKGTTPIGLAIIRHINWKDRNAEVGMVLGEPAEWGKGYGTEAVRLLLDLLFDVLGMHRVYGYTLEFNKASERLCAKLFAKKEGTLRQTFFRDGRYWDADIYSILEDEWRSMREGLK